ncbi:MAG: peptidoglycan editing factor PgeF [Firmicutes bacterium]|nr:peptidoglycan editing factor PgeF [Bacillota bacterium]
MNVHTTDADAGERDARVLVAREFAGSGAYAAFSTRLGGVSPAPYESLNLGSKVGDAASNVERNRELFWVSTGLDGRLAVRPEQVHSNVVAIVSRRDAGRFAPGADALVTRDPGLPLVAYFADCTPVFVFDPATRSGGIAHAGWRGTVKGIASRVVETMAAEFGARPSDCLAVIGPSIGPCCYDVGEDVAGQVAGAFPWASSVLQREPAGPRGPVWRFDLWETNRRLLLDAGLNEANVSCWRLCTASRGDLFFSYRRDGPRSGRMAGVLAIREPEQGA